MKLQAREWVICLNIQEPKMLSGYDRWHIKIPLVLEICILWSDLQEDTVKVLHESRSIPHEGGPAQRMVQKAISKVVLVASQLWESET